VSIDATTLAKGTRVPGTKWVVCGILGEGGWGVVLEVVKEPGIRGAMKVIHPRIGLRPELVERFLTEVRLLAHLQHRNIVRVLDFDRLEDGTPFLVMELLSGGTLRQVMRTHGRSLRAPMAYEIIRQACEGLDRAHSGTPAVVHRDFKPENVFLHSPSGDEPVIKLLDFGVAALVDGKRDKGRFGTPRYMAPEQLLGERTTPRTDIYAAAIVLYEMLTGRLPWDLNKTPVEDAHLSVAPYPPSRFAPWIPATVDEHIVKALARNPADRPHDVYAFMARLYQLQFAEGATNPIDVNTTAPTLATLADVLREPNQAIEVSSDPTYRGMTPPPLDGRSLEIAPAGARYSTDDVSSLLFRHPEAQQAVVDTRVPRGTPDIDRYASTPEAVAPVRAAPKHGTLPITLGAFASRSDYLRSEKASAQFAPSIAQARVSMSRESTPGGTYRSADTGRPSHSRPGLHAVVPIATFLAVVTLGTLGAIRISGVRIVSAPPWIVAETPTPAAAASPPVMVSSDSLGKGTTGAVAAPQLVEAPRASTTVADGGTRRHFESP
jgi:serine/threonine protein kinase